MRRSTSINEFTLRAKASLPREENGDELLKQWEERIATYKAAGLANKQATVYASLEFLCLTRIINEYDFDEIIANRPIGKPESQKRPGPKPQTPAALVSDPDPVATVACEGVEQSHRENLR